MTDAQRRLLAAQRQVLLAHRLDAGTWQRALARLALAVEQDEGSPSPAVNAQPRACPDALEVAP